jgi:hypothetical protein
VKRRALEFARALGREEFWQLEAAAMLSQLGYLSLPAELVEKLYYGETLSSEEKLLASGAPEVARRLLGNVPRLEPVTEILTAINAPDSTLQQLGDGPVGVAARILALVTDYCGSVTQGDPTALALKRLRSRSARYGAELVEQFITFLGPNAEPSSSGARKVPLRSVQPGMVILEDVRTHLGTLLVPNGFEITEVFLERLRHFGPEVLNEAVAVFDPDDGTALQRAGNA